MSKVITAIAELPTEALADWREWVVLHGGKVLTPKYITEGEKVASDEQSRTEKA